MKKRKLYRIVLTEKYEVYIAATSKAEAKDLVEEFGGKESFYRSETITLIKDQPLDIACNVRLGDTE